MLDDPSHQVRDFAFSVAPMRKGFLIRGDRFAYIQYKEDAADGIELFDTRNDPKQYLNLANDKDYHDVILQMQAMLASKLVAVRNNDLGVSGE